MNDVDPHAFVTRDGPVLEIDYAGIVAAMTGTEAPDWQDADGPETGVGVEYYFVHATGATAYVVRDQWHVTISLSDRDGDDDMTLAFDLADEA